MLIRFSIENYLSFSTKEEFNMISGNYKRHSDRLIKGQDRDLLTISSIYGENGAGKSNFIKGLQFLQNLVISGTRDIKDNISPQKYKLDISWLNKSTKFEIDFKYNSNEYNYYISINANRIEEEALYNITNIDKKERIFTRRTDEKDKSILKFAKVYPTNSKKKENLRRQIYQEDLRPNQPFLYEGFNKGMNRIKDAYNWFANVLRIIHPTSTYTSQIINLATEKNYQNEVSKLVKILKPGIENLIVDKINIDDFFSNEEQEKKNKIINKLTSDNIYVIKKNGLEYHAYLNKENKPEISKLITEHTNVFGDKVRFEIPEESDGTRRFIDLMPALISSKSKQHVYIIDELERSMHPLLVEQFIRIFIKNRCKSQNTQLIFSTHDTYLMNLDLFRQDEIWFVTNQDHHSKIYSLSDYKVRFDKKIEKAYMHGVFNAIPDYSVEDE